MKDVIEKRQSHDAIAIQNVIVMRQSQIAIVVQTAIVDVRVVKATKIWKKNQ